MNNDGVQKLQLQRLWLSIGAVLVLNVLVLSLMPLSPTSIITEIPFGDKVAHAAVYLVLMVWFGGIIPVRHYHYLFAVLLIYGAVIEVLQYFVPYRTMEPADLLADGIGLLLGWMLARAGLCNWCLVFESWFRKS
jgi:VanZ family protein